VRSNLFDAQATGRIVAKHIDIVANQANRANSGVIPISAAAFEFDENQISPFFARELGLLGIVASHGPLFSTWLKAE